ncbi:PREDICTED: uncharacterized protein LOC109115986 [Tarenaya hassleriana]|uniref:uncharacterized protein LOC109115986 n=1 Tax=Tarenaya hassleriana TaxID=28532 RepID=UPI0008FCFF13|nr:PREDICTED: uncharacterized protein LOC109115986 [Tarenaya hassleriana]
MSTETNTTNTPSDGTPVSTDTVHPYNLDNPSSPLININVTNISKLSTSNYLTWSLQIRSLLQGYNLEDFLDATKSTSPTITENTTTIPNPAYASWFRQDRLIFSALLGSISPSCQALIARATSTSEAWTTLASTYGRSSRGHIKQIKDHVRRFSKGGKSIDEFMHFFKTKGDELALLGKPLDHEDLVDLILSGLGEEYRPIKDAINAPDIPISFVELHERLLNHESILLASEPLPSVMPISSHNAQTRTTGTSSRPSWPPPSKHISRSPHAFSAITTTYSDWHSRLGHPSPDVLNKVINQFSLPLSSNKTRTLLCETCSINKSHKLPFSVSTLTSS